MGALITMNKAPNTLLFKHGAPTHAEHPAHGGQEVLSMASTTHQVAQRKDEEGSSMPSTTWETADMGQASPHTSIK